jgi:hypothetical protein
MKPVKFYEVQDSQGNVEWGGVSAKEAIEWLTRKMYNSIYVSVWDETDPEEPRLIIDKIEVTNLVLATMVHQRHRDEEREREPDKRQPWQKDWTRRKPSKI